MAAPALQLTGLQADLDPEAAARRELRVRVTAGSLRLSPAGIALLLPPHLPIRLERVEGNRLHLRISWKGLFAVAEAIPEGTPHGTLRLRFTGLRAGIFPLPADAILGALLSFAPRTEGVVVRGSAIEVDLQLLAHRFGVELPSLQRATLSPEGMELAFRSD